MVFLGVAGLLLLGAPSWAAAAGADRPPNIVHVVGDDIGYDDIGAFGGRDIPTPNLDRLARQGMRLTRFYAPSPLCTPTRAAILTGSYAPRVGLPDVLFPFSKTGIADTEITIAELLNRYGDTNESRTHALRGGKGSLWEGGVRVGAVARWKGRIPTGSSSDEVVAGFDLFATFARVAGAEPPADRVIDGRDIRPILFAEPGAKSPHEALYYYRGERLGAVRSGRWKLRGRPGRAAGRPGGPRRRGHASTGPGREGARRHWRRGHGAGRPEPPAVRPGRVGLPSPPRTSWRRGV